MAGPEIFERGGAGGNTIYQPSCHLSQNANNARFVREKATCLKTFLMPIRGGKGASPPLNPPLELNLGLEVEGSRGDAPKILESLDEILHAQLERKAAKRAPAKQKSSCFFFG